MLTGNADGAARLWETASGKLIHSFTGHTGSVQHVSFSPDRATILTASIDGTVRWWDLLTWQEVRSMKFPAGANLTISPDQTRLLTSNGTQDRVYDLESGGQIQMFRTLPGASGTPMAFSPEARRIAVTSAGQTKIFMTDTGEELHSLPTTCRTAPSCVFQSALAQSASFGHTCYPVEFCPSNDIHRMTHLPLVGRTVSLSAVNRSRHVGSGPPGRGGNEPSGQSPFVTTHWSAVLTAGSNGATDAQEALEKLCQTYWFPLYAYLRRRGYSPADAEDLTQGFFVRLLRLNSLADVQRAKGRFRSFLLAAMNHFVADERDRAAAQKRAVERTISLDAALAEAQYQNEPSTELSPDRLFERRWALSLLDTTLRQLQQDYERTGRGELFWQLRFAITGDKSSVPYGELATHLGMSEQAIRVAIHRLRQRYREVLRAEIGSTVASESEITAELKHLRRVLAS